MWFKSKQRRYLIYTPCFNPFSGGILLLHYLCHLLNEIGEQAYVVPIRRTKNPHGLKNPLGRKAWAKSAESVVIYPEVTDHNPLKAKNVVRWLLHKPGFHTGRINHGDDELTVAFAAHFAGEGQRLSLEQMLTIRYVMDDIYHDRGQPRSKCCHSIRKGGNGDKPLNMHPEDSICIDGLATHAEIADVFNQCHTFISYDPQSYYSIYASLCGCDSIVIPDRGVDKKHWKSDIASTYGLAYGFDDLDYARKTRPLLLEAIAGQKARNLEMTANFVRLCERHFFPLI